MQTPYNGFKLWTTPWFCQHCINSQNVSVVCWIHHQPRPRKVSGSTPVEELHPFGIPGSYGCGFYPRFILIIIVGLFLARRFPQWHHVALPFHSGHSITQLLSKEAWIPPHSFLLKMNMFKRYFLIAINGVHMYIKVRISIVTLSSTKETLTPCAYGIDHLNGWIKSCTQPIWQLRSICFWQLSFVNISPTCYNELFLK